MARGGTKFPLIVYKHLVGRWWTPMIAMGLVLFAIAYGQYAELGPFARFLPLNWMPFIVVGALCILAGIFFLVIRQLAYVQPFPGYLKFVTPFLRFNISYKRIHKTITAEMRYLFPPRSMSGWVRREIFAPLATQTAVVIELKGFPLSPFILRVLLSRFFFKDKTPHFVILVKDWMKFSGELDSYRTGVDLNPPPSQRKPRTSILSKLPQK
jgi:hypothetical protein